MLRVTILFFILASLSPKPTDATDLEHKRAFKTSGKALPVLITCKYYLRVVWSSILGPEVQKKTFRELANQAAISSRRLIHITRVQLLRPGLNLTALIDTTDVNQVTKPAYFDSYVSRNVEELSKNYPFQRCARCENRSVFACVIFNFRASVV